MQPFPPQAPGQQPPQAGAAPGAGSPMVAAAAPETGGGGPQKVANTEFNQQVQNILLSRIEEEGQKNPNFGTAIDSGISREAAMELALILPELNPIFRAMGLFEGMGDAPIGPGAAPGQPPAAPPAAPPGAAPAFPGAAAPAGADEGADPEDAADGGDDEEEEENPILRDGPASRGLVG